MSSIEFYDTHAADFFDRTANLSDGLDEIQARFLAHVPDGGVVLDAGCGSGRDALAFLKAGYRVSAFDGSAELAKLASAHTGLVVQHLRFAEMAWESAFDGIWACATLLHLPLTELPDAFARIAAALKPGGVSYASFKLGDGERLENGRHFTDLNPDTLPALVVASGLVVREVWTGPDSRPDAKWDWVSVIAVKRG